MAQEVAIVDSAQAEVLELAVALHGDGVVQLPRVAPDEGREALVREAESLGREHRLGEGVDLLPADLLVDVRGQEARGEPRILWFLEDERRRRLYRKLIELARRGTVVKAADRLGRHPHGVNVKEPHTAPTHRPDNLVHVDGLGGAVALADPHRRSRVGLLRRAALDWCARQCRAGAVCLGQHVSPPLFVIPRSLRIPRGEERADRARGARLPQEPSDRPSPPRATERQAGRGRRPGPARLESGWRQLGPSRLPRGFQVETVVGFLPGAGCWQVFGLASSPALGRVPSVHRFPTPRGQCLS